MEENKQLMEEYAQAQAQAITTIEEAIATIPFGPQMIATLKESVTLRTQTIALIEENIALRAQAISKRKSKAMTPEDTDDN